MFGLDFSEIADPPGFIMGQRMFYMHQIKNTIKLLHESKPEKYSGFRHQACHQTAQLFLPFASFRGRLGEPALETKLVEVVIPMAVLWQNGRELEREDLDYWLSKVVGAYEGLYLALEAKGHVPEKMD